jgi:hypothetical protein
VVVGAPLTAFAKYGWGVRPLAVGETLSLNSKLGVSIVKDRAALYFGPQDDPYVPVHLGVGVRGGTEIAVHLVRSVVEAPGGDASFALIRFHQRLRRSLQAEKSGYCAGEIPGVVSVREDVLCENLSPLVGWAQDDVRVGLPAGGSARTFCSSASSFTLS